MLIDRKKKNFVVTKLKHIFKQWRITSNSRRKAIEKVEKNSMKLLLQFAFNRISSNSRSEQNEALKQCLLLRLITCWERYRIRMAMSFWRHTNYKVEKAVR
jgi:hypothetical protein